MSYVLVATPAAADRPETKQTNKEVPTVVLEQKAINELHHILPPPAIPAGVTEEDMRKWQKVAICEQGGNWKVQGPYFSGGLGFRNYVWEAYGGLEYAPNAGLATPQQQVAIAKKINSNGYVPDQNGCEGGW
jgi:hypothetical protein